MSDGNIVDLASIGRMEISDLTIYELSPRDHESRNEIPALDP
ncbi:hypothetical protein ES708_24996 [subsurface metagenome]